MFLCRPSGAPADFIPGVVDCILKVLPGALVTPLPITPGFGFYCHPVFAGVALIICQRVAIAVGWLTSFIREPFLRQGDVIIGAEVGIVGGKAVCLFTLYSLLL